VQFDVALPTAVDRLIQQALHQVLMPLFDPGFSQHSYGFRPMPEACLRHDDGVSMTR
jgi:retron-type reverse transcriptase